MHVCKLQIFECSAPVKTGSEVSCSRRSYDALSCTYLRP